MTDALFWENRWQNQETGWDLGGPSPVLTQYLKDKPPAQNTRILIPGCGNAWEANWLLEHGYQDITLIDISPKACEEMQARLGSVSGLRIVCGDFFAHSGTYDLVLEQTFFCAIDRRLRADYVLKMSELLSPDGLLAGVLFSVEFPKMGPPFGGDVLDYEELFFQHFHPNIWEPCRFSHPKRAGNEWYFELKKKA